MGQNQAKEISTIEWDPLWIRLIRDWEYPFNRDGLGLLHMTLKELSWFRSITFAIHAGDAYHFIGKFLLNNANKKLTILEVGTLVLKIRRDHSLSENLWGPEMMSKLGELFVRGDALISERFEVARTGLNQLWLVWERAILFLQRYIEQSSELSYEDKASLLLSLNPILED